jgi:hypothetical protein
MCRIAEEWPSQTQTVSPAGVNSVGILFTEISNFLAIQKGVSQANASCAI